MGNIDFKSTCIGFLGAALIFTLMGAKQKKNLGDIVVNSITVLDDGYGGFITAYNQDQKRTLSYKEFNSIADDKCFAVVGRPIYEGNPLENIQKIINSAK